MSSSTHHDSSAHHNAGQQHTLRGAIICAIINTMLGVLLGVVILAICAPAQYTPKAEAKADAKTAQPALPAAGLYYWAGALGGNYSVKETQYLASAPTGVTASDAELNAWASDMFVSEAGTAVPVVKRVAPVVDNRNPLSKIAQVKAVVKHDVEAAEEDFKTWGITSGTPNFHTFKDPAAPANIPVSFQIAVPMTITLFGINYNTIYQARGVFVAGPTGPRFKPYYSFVGLARIPVLPGLAQKVFDTLAAKYTTGFAVKKYADAWAKLPHASVQDGALVLGGK